MSDTPTALTHLRADGSAHMVDVTDKKETAREAVAEGKILVNRDVFQAVKEMVNDCRYG